MNRVTVEALNLLAEDPEELIRYAEISYHRQMVTVAKAVKENTDLCRIILIAGPSSSGKTWSARLLCRELERVGIPPVMVSLDCFYRNREENRRLANGKPDFESIDALDLETLHQCMQELLQKRRTKLPHFDFVTGTRDRYDRIAIPEGGCLVMEGIHALNPRLLPESSVDLVHRVAVNVETNFFGKGGVCLTHHQLRLLRRMIRDYHHRGNTASNTLDLWPEVLAGERHYIIPYLSRAEYRLDTTHIYEPMVYRIMAEELLKGEFQAQYAETIQKLSQSLSAFTPLSPQLVPDDSLLVEFVR